jgi:hypothetical protein
MGLAARLCVRRHPVCRKLIGVAFAHGSAPLSAAAVAAKRSRGFGGASFSRMPFSLAERPSGRTEAGVLNRLLQQRNQRPLFLFDEVERRH